MVKNPMTWTIHLNIAYTELEKDMSVGNPLKGRRKVVKKEWSDQTLDTAYLIPNAKPRLNSE
jgi:hypothetical protein